MYNSHVLMTWQRRTRAFQHCKIITYIIRVLYTIARVFHT